MIDRFGQQSTPRLCAILAAPCVALLAAGCSPIKVERDYDPGYDFSRLKTFDWFELPDNAPLSQLTFKRVQRAVNAELAAKGYRQLTGTPDFLIAVHGDVRERIEIIDTGYGYWGYRGAPRTHALHYEEGSLILDFVDRTSKELIWRGSARASLDRGQTPEYREKRINEAVAKMLEEFPPR